MLGTVKEPLQAARGGNRARIRRRVEALDQVEVRLRLTDQPADVDLRREHRQPQAAAATALGLDNDDVMVGFCQHGPVMEISAADEAIGTAFYTLEQTQQEKPLGPVRNIVST